MRVDGVASDATDYSNSHAALLLLLVEAIHRIGRIAERHIPLILINTLGYNRAPYLALLIVTEYFVCVIHLEIIV